MGLLLICIDVSTRKSGPESLQDGHTTTRCSLLPIKGLVKSLLQSCTHVGAWVAQQEAVTLGSTVMLASYGDKLSSKEETLGCSLPSLPYWGLLGVCPTWSQGWDVGYHSDTGLCVLSELTIASQANAPRTSA